MKKTFPYLIIVLTILACSPIKLLAQSALGTIKGTVIDSANHQPIDFMTVALKKDKELIKTALTQSDGKFTFDKVAPGTYTVTAIAIGYTQVSKSVTLELGKPNLDMGNIPIKQQSNNLKEVTISADRPLIKQEVDRISYDIQADPESKALTALDMMRKVPLLSVDGDDNIKLKGSTGYKILINGKPSSMLANNPQDVLRNMPASSIQKIEVITTPPSKYDSEGLAGIINIITTKKIDNGYNGSVNIRENLPTGGPGIGGSLTFKRGKLGVSAYSGTGFNLNPRTEIFTSRISTGPGAAILTSPGSRRNTNNYRYGGAEISYEIDTLNLLTAEINPYSGYNKVLNFREYSIVPENGPSQSYTLDGHNRYEWAGLNLGLNYQLGFKENKEHLFTFSYRYNRNSNPQTNNMLVLNPINYVLPSYMQYNRGRYVEQTMQVDYVYPIKKLNIEAGVKGILRNNRSNFEYQSFDDKQGIYIPDPSKTNDFQNDQYVIGAYNSYAYKLDTWSFKGGVRLEETIIKADFSSTNSTLKTNYLNLIPTVSINRKFKNNSNLNFGYTQRIERPGIYNLNPFVDRSNPNFLSYGNPNLKPVLSNNIELNYSSFKKGSVNVGITYQFSNNTIQNVLTFDPATQITTATYYNIGKNRQLGATFNINYPLTSKWNISANGAISYLKIQGSIDGQLTQNDGVTGNAYLNTNYKFEKTWKVSASCSFNAPEVMLQGKSNSFFFLSITGSKDIIKDKLTLSATIRNPFSKYRYYTNTVAGENFVQTYRGQNYYRAFGVTLNWRFGKLEGDIKKNQRGIKNDDLKSGGSGN